MGCLHPQPLPLCALSLPFCHNFFNLLMKILHMQLQENTDMSFCFMTEIFWMNVTATEAVLQALWCTANVTVTERRHTPHTFSLPHAKKPWLNHTCCCATEGRETVPEPSNFWRPYSWYFCLQSCRSILQRAFNLPKTRSSQENINALFLILKVNLLWPPSWKWS